MRMATANLLEIRQIRKGLSVTNFSFSELLSFLPPHLIERIREPFCVIVIVVVVVGHCAHD